MEKIITISGKDFKIRSSAFTPFAYKNETGRDLLSDINKINQLNVEISKISDEEERNSKWMDEVTNILEMVLKMAYLMIKEANKNIEPYEEWLKTLDDIMGDTAWLTTTLEVGISPISRGQLQTNKNQ